MAETEGRAKQDIGQDEAYVVNLKQAVENAQDIAGRNRIIFDAMAINMSVCMGAINKSIVEMAQQGATAAGKTAENIIGVNETDQAVREILNSPWAEALKTLAVAVANGQNPEPTPATS